MTLAPASIAAVLDLDEIADSRLRRDVGARPQAGERADRRAARDPRPFEMREAVDDRAVLDRHAGADDDMRLDEHVAANARVPRQEHGLRRDKRRAAGHRAHAQPTLHRGLRGCELHSVVDAHNLVFPRLKGQRPKATGVGDLDDVGEVVLLGDLPPYVCLELQRRGALRP